MSPEDALIREVKKYYLEKNEIKNNFHKIPIGHGYVRLAIVREKLQQEKMQKAFGEVGKTNEKKSTFEDKRLTCFEQIYGTKESVDLKDIFEPDKEGKSESKIPKRLLVLGRAGIGKSILCQYMAYQWANPSTEVKLWQEGEKERFKLVVWVRLRNLLGSNSKTIYDVILNEVVPKNRYDSSKKTLSIETVTKALDQINPSEVLFILDGYDEVAGKENQIIKDLFKQENFILTSRPHGVEQCPAFVSMDRKLENIGFLDEDIEKYVEAFLSENEKSVNLINFLKAHPNIWGIAHIPINLMLICVGWRDNHKRFNLKTIKNITITDLYRGLMVNLGHRYLGKNEIKLPNDFTAEDVLEHKKCKSVLAVLSELAFKQMDDESLLIPGTVLSRARLQKQYPALSSLREDVIHFGVLTSTDTETHKESAEFYFVHLTFQEFLAAFNIAEKLRTNAEGIKQYISSNKYSLRHEMVWWFVAGLLKEEINILERFFDILEDEPRNLAQICHQILLMRCMDECQLKVKPERKKSYLNNVCKIIDINLSEKRFFYRAFQTYLNLSEIVFNQGEVVDKYYGFLSGKDNFKKCAALDILNNQFNVPQKIVNGICDLLKDQAWEVRSAAFKFFEGREKISKEVQRKVVGLLIDKDEYVRSVAFRFFEGRVKISKEVQKKVVGLLIDKDEYVRSAAFRFFKEREKISEEIQISMASLLSNENKHVRSAAFNFFGSRKEVSEEIQRNVVDLLKHPEENVRSTAVRFFGSRKEVSEEFQRNVACLLRDEDKNIRSTAVWFFIGRKNVSEEIQRSIVDLFRDEDIYVRNAASRFFVGRKEVSEEIQRSMAGFLRDKDEKVRAAAVEFFESREEVSEEIQRSIVDLFRDEGEKVRAAAVEFFESREEVPEEVQRSVASLLSDKNENVRSAAVRFFESREEVPEEVQRSVASLLSDKNENVRSAAVRFFESRKEVPEEVQRSVASLLSDKNENVRSAAVRFFESRKEVPEEIQRIVVGLLIDKDEYVRSAAFSFFESRKEVPKEVQRSVASLLSDKNENVRSAAVRFFKSRKEVPEEVQRNVASLLSDLGADVRSAAIRFFRRREKISEEIQKIVASLLKDPDENVKEAAIRFFESRKEVLEGIPRIMTSLLMDKDEYVRSAAFGFFESRKEVPEEIQIIVVGLVKCEDKYLRSVVFRFFESRKEVPEEVQRSVAGLLSDKNENVRSAAIKFFESRKEVPEEVQRSVAGLLSDKNENVRSAAIKFFESRKEVPEEVQRSVAGLLSDKNENVRSAAVSFLEDRQEFFPSVFEIVGSFLKSGVTDNRENAMYFLLKISVSQMIKCLKQLNKRNLNDEFLFALIIKLLMLNLPVYTCDENCIQIGEGDPINFESKEAIAEFVSKSQKIFRELVGLNLDGNSEKFSEARAISRYGQFSADRVVVGDDVETEELRNEEESRWCVVL